MNDLAMMANYAGSATVRKVSRSQFNLSLDEIITFDALIRALHNASCRRKFRSKVASYLDNAGGNLLNLQKRIYERTYQPRPCNTFEIFCTAGQKVRTISAPVFEDTIVQHLLYGAVYDTFDRSFIFDSYGCRRGKGTHKAADRVQAFMREASEDSYYLQIDIRRYYYNINHRILRESLSRRIADSEVLDLLMAFCGDNGGVGLNVGSLLSQLFGMVYLDRFDHWVKRELKIKHYIRFVDDCLFILPTREEAMRVKELCETYLREELHLTLSKWRVHPISRGANFVGVRTWRHKRIIRRRSLHNFGRKLRQRKLESIVSILGHAKGTSSYSYLLNRCLDELPVEDIRSLPKPIRAELSRIALTTIPDMPDIPESVEADCGG